MRTASLHSTYKPFGTSLKQPEAERYRANTCAGKSYTRPYMFSYVTARPYCCTTVQDSLHHFSALRGLLRVEVHVLRVSQQADALLLLSLFCHLKKHRRPTLVHDWSHLSSSHPLPLTGPRSLAVDSPHRSVHSKRLTDATAKLQLQIYLLTKAEYKGLIMKLGHMKFQRSSKASES